MENDFASFGSTLRKVRRNTLLAKNSQTSLENPAHSTTTDFDRARENDCDLTRPLAYNKGHPLYKLKPEDSIPKFWYLEHFKIYDFCFFNPDMIETRLKNKNWSSQAIKLCILLIHDAIVFCVDRKFGNWMGVSTMEIMYQAFDFLMGNTAATLRDLHTFFRNMILLYAVEDPPKSMALFTPKECFVIAQYFASQFDPVFLLMKAVLMPNYTVKICVEDT